MEALRGSTTPSQTMPLPLYSSQPSQWDESGQTVGQRQAGAEHVTDSAKNLQAIDPDAMAAALASVEDTLVGAIKQPVTQATGA